MGGVCANADAAASAFDSCCSIASVKLNPPAARIAFANLPAAGFALVQCAAVCCSVFYVPVQRLDTVCCSAFYHLLQYVILCVVVRDTMCCSANPAAGFALVHRVARLRQGRPEIKFRCKTTDVRVLNNKKRALERHVEHTEYTAAHCNTLQHTVTHCNT